jgi:hypothetical protein
MKSLKTDAASSAATSINLYHTLWHQKTVTFPSLQVKHVTQKYDLHISIQKLDATAIFMYK